MPKLLKIGIVGCGAIGTSLAKTILSDFSGKAELVAIYDIDIEKAYKLANLFENNKLVALSLNKLIDTVNFIIEASKAESSFAIAKQAVMSSRDIMIMSVGGIIKNFEELSILAREKDVKIYIPSGAICGIDGLKAAAIGKINRVILTTRKPPEAYKGSVYVLKNKINLDRIGVETVLFEGCPLDAVRAFPQNINVAAILNIVSLGAKEILIRIIAQPGITRNTHQLEVDSDSARLSTYTENIIHPDNPKTSYLAVLSAIATLKQILEPIRVGT
jgi:aspartate dehydrogenase